MDDLKSGWAETKTLLAKMSKAHENASGQRRTAYRHFHGLDQDGAVQWFTQIRDSA
jgi:hypothetical protein